MSEQEEPMPYFRKEWHAPSYAAGFKAASELNRCESPMQHMVDIQVYKLNVRKLVTKNRKLRAEIRALHLRLRDANRGIGRHILTVTDHSARIYHEAERLREENARLRKELDELKGGTL